MRSITMNFDIFVMFTL